MKVLVIGSGGREHALCWHLKRQTPDLELYCAPGNVGIAEVADLAPIPVDEIQQLADFAEELEIDLTVVGPELPLSLGIVDEFESRDLRIFGPHQEAARLESSKAFAKEFMSRHEIPTADFDIAHDRQTAEKAARRFGFPVALKADGLAAGKGVLLVQDDRGLAEALEMFFEERRFGASGDCVVVERFLEGEEVSFIGLSDGTRLLPLATSKDYKRIGEDDTGPNTGGMGAHSPSGVVGAQEAEEILANVMNRTIEGMADDGTPFVGVLYAGLMLTDEGPQVLEYNVRLGDPEAQVLMLRIDEDLVSLLRAGAEGRFGVSRVGFRREAAACVVLAARGYPGTIEKGAVITGIEQARSVRGVEVFHAGTARQNGELVVSGGRVLNVCATGGGLREALRNAYRAAGAIHWPGQQKREDIGKRVLASAELLESGIMQIPRELLRERRE